MSRTNVRMLVSNAGWEGERASRGNVETWSSAEARLQPAADLAPFGCAPLPPGGRGACCRRNNHGLRQHAPKVLY